MFNRSGITSFNTNLPGLENGKQMFCECAQLVSVNSKMPKLKDGSNMFANCRNLKSFSADLSSLENGLLMFSRCGDLSFRSPLPKLINGTGMFNGCKLDMESLRIIAESLPKTVTRTSDGQGVISLGSVDNTDEAIKLIRLMQSKGWRVMYHR